MEQQRNRSVDARSPIDQNMFADLFVENQIEPINECDVDELLLEGKSAKTSDDEKRTKKRGVSGVFEGVGDKKRAPSTKMKIQKVPKVNNNSNNSNMVSFTSDGIQKCKTTNCEGACGTAYQVRSKICEICLNAPEILDEDGKKVRFCQKCTRTHFVEEFQGSRKACIKSLARVREKNQILSETLKKRVKIVKKLGESVKKQKQQKNNNNNTPATAAAPAAAANLPRLLSTAARTISAITKQQQTLLAANDNISDDVLTTTTGSEDGIVLNNQHNTLPQWDLVVPNVDKVNIYKRLIDMSQKQQQQQQQQQKQQNSMKSVTTVKNPLSIDFNESAPVGNDDVVRVDRLVEAFKSNKRKAMLLSFPKHDFDLDDDMNNTNYARMTTTTTTATRTKPNYYNGEDDSNNDTISDVSTDLDSTDDDEGADDIDGGFDCGVNLLEMKRAKQNHATKQQQLQQLQQHSKPAQDNGFISRVKRMAMGTARSITPLLYKEHMESKFEQLRKMALGEQHQ